MRATDINWLRCRDKQLPTPQILFRPIKTGGLYVRPQSTPCIVGKDVISPCNGTIIISTRFPENTACALAHEWRHHWQMWNGWEFDVVPWGFAADYETELRNFFRKSRIERDALRFQMRMEPKAECNEQWREILEGHVEL